MPRPDLRSLKPSPFPAHVDLMLCSLVDEPFDDDQWIFEDKLDGLRVVGRFDGKQLTLLSRNDISQNLQFPEIVEVLGKNLPKPAIVDGEIVCFDESGHPSFRELQQRFHITDRRTVELRMKQHPAYIYLFDILYFDRYDVRKLPLERRKKLLRSAIHRWKSPIFWTAPTPGKGVQKFQEICQRHGEGIVAKRLASPYVGTRSEAWLKIKCSGRQEFVIGGFTDPEGSRVGFGAILVGTFDPETKKLIYAGKVGTGFSDKVLQEMRKVFDHLETKISPFIDEVKSPRGLPRGPKVHFVEPRLVAEIGFAEWTRHGNLRQPRFEGLREDKRAASVRRETPKAVKL